MSNRRPTSIDLTARLVGFDTTSAKSNLALIEFVQTYLSDLGVESSLIYDEGGMKANLFATLGPNDKPGIVLSGHTDVVPVDVQDWDSAPFKAMERDGKLYGRGACDMKGFIATVLTLVPQCLAKGLRAPVHLAFSYDEEVGCIGARQLAAYVAELPARPIACIIGEPTEMKVITGCKGKKWLRCTVHGLEGHSSKPAAGVNAIEVAAEIVVFIKRLARRLRENGPFDAAFDPPHATVHAGTIRGGNTINVIAKNCALEFEIRHLPDQDPEVLLDEVKSFVADSLLADMQRVDSNTGVSWEVVAEYPGFSTAEDAEVTQLAKTLTGTSASEKVAFGTEAGHYHNAGIPTTVCGPGSIKQAHKPNEFITFEQLSRCESFLSKLLERFYKD